MHSQLYRGWMPECVEDAYTSLATYHAAAPGAKATALHIIEERVNRLIRSQPPDECNVAGLSSGFLVDTPTHLARTQALFVYQLVRLFDGDIRARARAETHIDVLHTWANRMLESARLDCAAAELLSTSPAEQSGMMLLPMSSTTTNDDLFQVRSTPSTDTAAMSHDGNALSLPSNPFLLPPHASTPLLWHAWITAESIRRTYLAATFMQSVYNTLKQGWSICPGGAAFTALNGLWDARSGYAWLEVLQSSLRASTEGGGEGILSKGLSPWALIQSLEGWRVLEAARPEEVDEFTRAVLEISYGVERVEGWCFGHRRGREAGPQGT
ncbi:hypothetical protein MFIFM68171_11172 [Madurella fahalii]|uniref:Uncharacterized protein n=1 Tax=Madurella fahalii TaxID=1157608 RepID=A0ABQ0GT95_9PEZI